MERELKDSTCIEESAKGDDDSGLSRLSRNDKGKGEVAARQSENVDQAREGG